MFRLPLLLCLLLSLSALAQSTAPQTQPSSQTNRPQFMPQPQEFGDATDHSTFAIRQETRIRIFAGPQQPDAKCLEPIAELLAAKIKVATGFNLKIDLNPARPENEPHIGAGNAHDIILMTAVDDAHYGPEDYAISIFPQCVMISAFHPAGFFYAVQTFDQLLTKDGVLAAGAINDSPRFPTRSYMLDVSRHFRSKAYVLRTLDVLASLKMNTLHLHLTDDQGWRIEIKKYPKLTEIGAWRTENGKKYGGFYTQDDIKEIVAYAAARFITVVPEIEMPGHATAALAAYPELSCTGGPFQVGEHWGVFNDVYCAGNDQVFQFNEDVLTEVMDLFPSKVIHIGGDECPKTRWNACDKCKARMQAEHLKNANELQSYFIKRIDTFLTAKGRRTLGWDEILEGGLAPGAAVQSWRGMDGAIAAAKSGHDVIASPNTHCYLDHSLQQISLEKVFSFEPVPAALTAEQATHIIGIEGCLWSEHTPEEADVDRQTFPRLCALAEAGWSPKASRDFKSFQSRLPAELTRLKALGVTIPTP